MQDSSILSSLIWIIIPLFFGLVLYVYFAVTLMAIARKTATPGGGLAWIPILNFYLMCRIGRRPGWWVLLLFIPLVGLIVFPIIWMSIAEMCGKPAWTGALLIIPLAGLVIPLYLALGKAPAPPQIALGTRNCLKCGNQIIGDETFCRMCGEAAETIVAGQRTTPELKPRTSTGQYVLVGGGIGVAVLLITGIVGWLALTSIFAYAGVEREPPAISKRTEGTLTEFPVDTDSDEPLAPESVSTEDLENPAENDGTDTDTEKQTNKRLPPGLTRDDLKKRGGKTLTTTIYRPTKTPAGNDDNIYISVVNIPSGNGKTIATTVARQTNGSQTGTRVESPGGGVYTGSKIQTPNELIYIFEKDGAPIVIIIYTPNQGMQTAAARLAGNIGNGDGINDYPQTRTTVWTLPQKPPTDLVLVDFRAKTRADLGLTDSDLDNAGESEEEKKLLRYFSQFIPERVIEARYRDSGGRDWEVGVFDYDSTMRAWRTWIFLSWTLGLSGESVGLKHGSGVLADTDDGKRMLIFQKGPYLIFIQAPSNAATDKIISFGDSIQV